MTDVANQFFYISAPRAKAGEPGRVAALPVSATQAVLDLTTITAPVYDGENAATANVNGALGSFVTIVADGADVGVIFGTAKADVTAGNKPVLGTQGAVDSNGVYTPAAGECFVIKSGTQQQFRLQPKRTVIAGAATTQNTDQWMGYVGSGAGTMRIYQSSPPGFAAR